MRKILGLLGIASFAVLCMPASAFAGAEGPPTDACTFSVATVPSPLVKGQLGSITVSGTAPASQNIKIFIADPTAGALPDFTTTSDAAGNFSKTFDYTPLNGTFSITITYAEYTLGKCDPGNIEVSAGGGNIAFTGSNTTKPSVAIGIAAVAIGAVLVASSRRRRSVGAHA